MVSCYDENGKLLEGLTQWDHDITLKITDIAVADVVEVHIYNFFCSEALVLKPTAAEDGIIVPIPNILLTEATTITVCIYRSIGEKGEYTSDVLRLSVKAEKKPASYVYTETEVLSYATLDRRVTKLEESGGSGNGGKDGKSAYEIACDNGFDGTEQDWLESLNGEDGHTPKKGEDYWTEEDKVEIVDDVLAALPVWEGGSY